MKFITDTQAWQTYPFHRKWFNKLWVSELFGYVCGPNAVPVPVEGIYIIRPIYNLHGMGAGARFVHLTTEDIDTVPPGYFWCEKFTGRHISVDLCWVSGMWEITSIFEGVHYSDEQLYRFSKWMRIDTQIEIPKELDELWDCGYINIELIDNKIIEVHLRGSPDPIQYKEIVPVWSDTSEDVIKKLEHTHKYVPSFDYVYYTDVSRLGFFCK